MTLLRRLTDHLFATAANRDGQAPGLERQALGEGGLVPAGSMLADAALSDVASDVSRPAPGDEIHGLLARKILEGWAANRTQVLHPLTLNFSLLPDAQADVLISVAASVLRAYGQTGPRDLARAQTALRHARATEAHLTIFAAFCESGRDLGTDLDRAQAEGLGGYVFAAAAAVSDHRDPSARAFLTFLRLRLDLPVEVASGLARRHRR